MDPIDALEECWQLWADVLGALEPPQWSAPTRSTGWDVKTLATHHAGWVLAFAAIGDHVVEHPGPRRTAADLLRGFNAPGGAAVVAAAEIEAQTREFAATLSTDQLVAAFREVAVAAIAAARQVSDAVDYMGVATTTVAQVATIGVVEATVHGLDLLAAVGEPAERIPESAQALVVDVLVAVPGRLAFIEGATGRRTVFPVLR
jgi:uncharacterized protein (TIGR03083 family)